ncbi:hypothetical protein FO519_005739 [Halicephalobus sp. NKZ332]|nr:hypothetical protein FO519_005739 [Halicephalobus sp. NKZ332]
MREMEQMMDGMMGDPFRMMDDFFGMGQHRAHHPMLENGNSRRLPSGRSNVDNQIANPFGGFGFGLFGNMMHQMGSLQNEAMSSPSSHVFTQSTMISYDGSGQPKVVQNSVRKTGDVKETRRTVRDGGREEMTVGHAIGDREHIIEKKRDKDGKVRKNQRFVNLDEADAETFNHEFKNRAHRNIGGFFGESNLNHTRAIENGRNEKDDEVLHSGHSRPSRSSRAPQPIIEIPDDDEDNNDIVQSNHHNNRQRPSRGHHNGHNGPIISEVTEDDAGSSKRRKGMFGRFFADGE